MATSGFGTYLENELLDHAFSAATFTAESSVWLALYSAAPTKAGGGTELTGNGYARAEIVNNATNFPAASGGAKTTGASVTVGPASGGAWSEATHWAILDASTAGNLLCWGPMTTPRTAGDGDSIVFATGDIDITLDNVT